MKIAKYVLPVIAAGLMSSTAMAQSASWSVNGANSVAGTVANALTADGAGTDWTAAVLVVDISGSTGSIHNDVTFGTDSAPNPAFFGAFPDLEFDSYVGIIGGVNDVGPLGAGDLGSPALSVTGQLVSATWGGTDVTNTGPTQIANITLTPDSQGTWQLLTSFAGGLVVQSGGSVVNGEILNVVPEPASLALMGIGGLAALRRRR